jgi:CheY-like chemotaxis protein
MEDIFLPFHQVHKTRLTTEGTGLGLPISRNLVRLMGGELQVKSIKGEGTTFSFDLELPEVRDVTATDFAEAVRPSQGIVGVKGNRRRVLLVDDNDDNRATLRAMLSPLGFEIGEAADGEDAITEATAFRPELILMDLVMPVVDGLEATRRIRQISVLDGVVVIGVSASLLGGERQRSLAAGCDDFLAKPVNMDELLACLQRHLRIEWLYEKPSSKPPAGRHETGQFVVPPREDLEALLEFAEISHVTGLQQSLESMKKVNERFTPFATVIEELLEGFQFDKIIKMIESYLQNNDE